MVQAEREEGDSREASALRDGLLDLLRFHHDSCEPSTPRLLDTPYGLPSYAEPYYSLVDLSGSPVIDQTGQAFVSLLSRDPHTSRERRAAVNLASLSITVASSRMENDAPVKRSIIRIAKRCDKGAGEGGGHVRGRNPPCRAVMCQYFGDRRINRIDPRRMTAAPLQHAVASVPQSPRSVVIHAPEC